MKLADKDLTEALDACSDQERQLVDALVGGQEAQLVGCPPTDPEALRRLKAALRKVRWRLKDAARKSNRRRL